LIANPVKVHENVHSQYQPDGRGATSAVWMTPRPFPKYREALRGQTVGQTVGTLLPRPQAQFIPLMRRGYRPSSIVVLEFTSPVRPLLTDVVKM
jgi:hypothetical protein